MSGPGTTAGAPAHLRETNPILVRYGHFLFKYRKFVLPTASLAVLLGGKPRLFLGSESSDRALDALGILFAFGGQALRAAVIGLAYIKRGGESGTIHADRLVVEGLFAHSRNPLYVGNMLEFTGLCLILNTPAAYLFGIPFFALAYYSIVLAEEDFLRAKFGAVFEAYRRRVNRFIPSPRGLSATLKAMEFNWKRLVRKEYGTTFVWLTTLLALLGWESCVFRGWQASLSTFRLLGSFWLLILLGYLAARLLKKTGRLGRT